MEDLRDAPALIAETHISVIAMVGDRAYKLLKPVDLGFLDHRRREDRLAACRRETEVNRRFAPDVYLGVLDVLDADGTARDHLIEMRRMPASRRLSALVDDPAAPALVRSVARAIAAFHREAPVSAGVPGAGGHDAVLGLWEEGLDQLGAGTPGVVPPGEVARARALARRYLAGRAGLLERRVDEGWVRDGHGDLLADDVYCLADGPRVLDCLAFDDRLRHGDVLGDVAFLAMDLEAHGHPDLGALLIDEWRGALAEDHPASLAHHYIAYRAHVRSKVAALRSGQGDPTAADRARALHAVCLDHLECAEVRMVLVGGAPGTGKSTLAAGLGAATGWTVLRTDVIRKDLAGRPHAPDDPGAYRAGLYAPEASRRVYARMLDDAGRLLAMGESVVLDASWGDAALREAARRAAASAAARVVEIRCDVDRATAAARIAARRAAGEGPSDATPGIAARVASDADPWPEAQAIGTGPAPPAVLARACELVGPGATCRPSPAARPRPTS